MHRQYSLTSSCAIEKLEVYTGELSMHYQRSQNNGPASLLKV